jgi:hypothetical protein
MSDQKIQPVFDKNLICSEIMDFAALVRQITAVISVRSPRFRETRKPGVLPNLVAQVSCPRYREPGSARRTITRCNLARVSCLCNPETKARTGGKRKEKRIAVLYPVKLWGMDSNGRPFIEAATTLNVSGNGALLNEVPAKLAVGDVIGLSSEGQKYRFRIAWLGQAGTPEAGHLGLQSLENEKRIWDMELPCQSIDIYTRPQQSDNRLLPRLQCCLSTEVGSNTSAGRVQAFVTDISLGSAVATFQLQCRSL